MTTVLKQSDTYPALPIRVEAEVEEDSKLVMNGVDLKDAVTIMVFAKTGSTVIEGEATAVEGTKGEEGYAELPLGDVTMTPGEYEAEVKITWSDGIQSFPNEGVAKFKVEPSL